MRTSSRIVIAPSGLKVGKQTIRHGLFALLNWPDIQDAFQRLCSPRIHYQVYIELDHVPVGRDRPYPLIQAYTQSAPGLATPVLSLLERLGIRHKAVYINGVLLIQDSVSYSQRFFKLGIVLLILAFLASRFAVRQVHTRLDPIRHTLMQSQAQLSALESSFATATLAADNHKITSDVLAVLTLPIHLDRLSFDASGTVSVHGWFERQEWQTVSAQSLRLSQLLDRQLRPDLSRESATSKILATLLFQPR